MVQDLDDQGGETAAGLVGHPLHEQHHRIGGDGLADEVVDRNVAGHEIISRGLVFS